MGVRLYVDATEAAVEKFFKIPQGSIAECVAIMATVPEGHNPAAYEAWEAANERVTAHVGGIAYSFLNEEPFGYAAVRTESEAGSAKGVAALRVLSLQRARYGNARERFGEDAARLRALCDRVALACADGRFAGVYWG